MSKSIWCGTCQSIQETQSENERLRDLMNWLAKKAGTNNLFDVVLSIGDVREQIKKVFVDQAGNQVDYRTENDYQEGDLEKFFGCDPDFTGELSTADHLAKIREPELFEKLEQLEAEIAKLREENERLRSSILFLLERR